MQWTRPLEVFLELTVAFWVLDMLSKPLKKKEQADMPAFPREACQEIQRPI